jgi:hypothetical protein
MIKSASDSINILLPCVVACQDQYNKRLPDPEILDIYGE